MKHPHSTSPFRITRAGRRAFTLIEILSSLLIAMTFLISVYTSFIHILRTADLNSAELEALRSGRGAIMTMWDEFKGINALGANFVPSLIGIDQLATFGDGLDQDDDGRVDEEVVNGRDDDFDWVPALHDVHAQFVTGNTTLYERYQYTSFGLFGGLYGLNADDLGDLKVDEDCKFGRDSVVFKITPTTPIDNLLFRTITYTIGSYDGQPNVLIRQARTEFTQSSGKVPLVSTTPLAFGVLGLDLLYWDPNGNPNPGSSRSTPSDTNPGGSPNIRPYWMTVWNSTNSPTFDPPKLPLPASIYIRVTMYADRTAQDSYKPGQPVRTLKVESIVNIEDIIGDLSFPRPII